MGYFFERRIEQKLTKNNEMSVEMHIQKGHSVGAIKNEATMHEMRVGDGKNFL